MCSFRVNLLDDISAQEVLAKLKVTHCTMLVSSAHKYNDLAHACSTVLDSKQFIQATLCYLDPYSK